MGRRALVSLVGWFACLGAAAACAIYAPPLELPGLPQVRLNGLLAMGWCATGTVIAAVEMLLARRACAGLARQLSALSDAGRLRRLEMSGPDVGDLADAVNGMVQTAEQAISSAHMQVKELQIQLKVAHAERQHAEAILYSISDAVLVTDPFDELVLANESAARVFEFDLQRASRAPIDQLVRDARMVELIREMRLSNSRSGRRVVEHQIQGSGGPTPQTYKVTLSCVSGQGDEATGVVAVLHDMTKEREIAQMKNDFVSNVSHELRTPLASIKAYVEMLIDGEADDEKTRREFYEVIQNESNRLGRLIDNILNVSRIESGLVRINKQPQSVMVIVKEAIEVIAPQAKVKRLNLMEQLTPAYYQTLADKDMLYQAVLNLLSNAVKYTPEGGTITVQTLIDEEHKKVITRVTDTGVGIPPKDLPHVFDKFYRCEAHSHMAKGTGLGLSLAKQIVETVHRGRVFAESEMGKGSCFGFELDLCE